MEYTDQLELLGAVSHESSTQGASLESSDVSFQNTGDSPEVRTQSSTGPEDIERNPADAASTSDNDMLDEDASDELSHLRSATSRTMPSPPPHTLFAPPSPTLQPLTPHKHLPNPDIRTPIPLPDVNGPPSAVNLMNSSQAGSFKQESPLRIPVYRSSSQVPERGDDDILRLSRWLRRSPSPGKKRNISEEIYKEQTGLRVRRKGSLGVLRGVVDNAVKRRARSEVEDEGSGQG